MLPVSAIAETALRGAEIYRAQCIECHGETGEGSEFEEVDALYGDRSVASLAKIIGRTMPEDDPDLCVGEDAEAVAQYIFDAFYSLEARKKLGRGGLAKIEMARLTVPQYRNALADLVGSFGHNSPDHYEKTGLKGFYFQSKGMQKMVGKGVERLDTEMRFDFGEAAPVEGIAAGDFSAFWEGSFFARETGIYQFRLRTPNGARLYVNGTFWPGQKSYRDDSANSTGGALIDEWVSSGEEMRESVAKLFLLGGRHYPLRLEYFKFQEKIGKVALDWKQPHSTWKPLGGDVLSPAIARRVFVPDVAFPADDRSLGYERGASVSKAWDSATTKGAIAAADEIDARLEELARIKKKDSPEDRTKKLKDFCTRFASAAFRRPLGDTERTLYVDAQFSGSADPEVAVKRCVLLALKSPRFLFPELRDPNAKPTLDEIGARLAFSLWDSVPDHRLREAAEKGWLGWKSGVRDQAVRMVKDPRAAAKMTAFFEHWLEMEERDLSKDKALFPQFDASVVSDLRESLLRFVDSVMWSERSDYRELLTADYLLLNHHLAKLYGGDVKGDSFQRSKMGGSRAGVLTHPYLLSAFAYHNTTSPIHRGVFMTRNVVGRALKPPPVAVAFKDDEFDPHLTMREKVTHLTRDSACMSCHSVINPLGFSLENFDAVGRWRDIDNDKKIDTRSEYTTLEGETITLANAKDVAHYAIASPAAQRAFVKSLFHHMVKQPVAAYGPGTLGELREFFVSHEFNMRELMVEIAVTQAIHSAELK